MSSESEISQQPFESDEIVPRRLIGGTFFIAGTSIEALSALEILRPDRWNPHALVLITAESGNEHLTLVYGSGITGDGEVHEQHILSSPLGGIVFLGSAGRQVPYRDVSQPPNHTFNTVDVITGGVAKPLFSLREVVLWVPILIQFITPRAFLLLPED